MNQGTEALTELAETTRLIAVRIREFRATRMDAATIEKAADALERLAPLEPDIEIDLPGEQ